MPASRTRCDQLVDARALISAFGDFANPQAERDVLEHGHVSEQGVVLKHEADVAIAGRAAA